MRAADKPNVNHTWFSLCTLAKVIFTRVFLAVMVENNTDYPSLAVRAVAAADSQNYIFCLPISQFVRNHARYQDFTSA